MPQSISLRRPWGIGRTVFLAGGLFLTAAILFFSAFPASAQRGVAVSFLPDASAAMSVREAASLEKAGEYQLYVPSFMAFSRLPKNFNGAIWLRFTLGSSFEKPVGGLLVNLGARVPGLTRLYIPQEDDFATIRTSSSPAVFTLPDSGKFPESFYIRLDGTPGLWFRPVITEAGTAKNALPPHHLMLAGLFGVAMLLLLAQYLREAKEWRLWAAITAGCGVVAAFLPSAPAAGSAYTPLAAAGMLMPGVIIVLFAHTARHLFNAPKNLAGYDAFLNIYYVLGAAIALFPLIPGFLYTSRYLPLSFAVLLPLLFVAMTAFGRSLKGAAPFLCACLLVAAGVIGSAWELTASDMPLIGGLGGLAGLGFGLAILGLSGPAKAEESATGTEEDVFDTLHRACRPTEQLLAEQLLAEQTPRERQPAGERQSPLDIAPWNAAEKHTQLTDTPGNAPAAAPENVPGTTPEETPVAAPGNTPGDAHAAAPESAPETTPVKTSVAAPGDTPGDTPGDAHAAAPENTVPQTAEHPPLQRETEHGVTPQLPAPEISLVDDLPVIAPPSEEQPVYRSSFAGETDTALFDLPLLVKNAYDDISPLAEKKSLGMSWFIAPQTGRLFGGDKALLDSALRMLLRDMVEAIDRGNVRLTVRRLPDSKDAGHIVFTFTEWDARKTFYARNMDGLSEAWALAEKTGGIFSVEHSPTSGTSVIFSSVFTPEDTPKETEEKPAVSTAPPPKDAEAAHHTADQAADETAFAATAHNAAAPHADNPQPVDLVHKFTDYPDIDIPEGLEVIAAPPVPAGVDGEDLAENGASKRAPARLIVADITASGRSRLKAAFANSPYSILEGTSPQAACALYKRNPSALVVMSAAMPETDIAEAIRDMHAEDENTNRTPVPVLTLVEHEAQAGRMAQIGCAKTLMKPLADDALLLAAQELAPLSAPGRAEPKAALPEALPIPAEALEPAAAFERGPEPEPAADPLFDPALSPERVLNAALNDIPEETPPAKSAEPPEAIRSGIFSSALPGEKDGASTGAAENEKKNSGSGLSLIDMIVTDEEEDEPGNAKAAEAPETPKAPETSAAPKSPAAPETSAAPKSPAAPEAPKVFAMPKPPAAPETSAAPETPVAPKPSAAPEAPKASIAPVTSKTSVAPATPKPTVAPEPEAAKTAAPKIRTIIRSKKIVKKTGAPTLSDPDPAPDDALPATALVTDDGRMPPPAIPSSGVNVQLPGEEDGIFKDMIPLIPGLIHELADAMEDAAKGREQKSPMLVQEAAERVAGKAETFGLARLERMARCVERAAAADDVEPMECVLDDLASWVERYKKALSLLHREHKW